ncbi:MAG: hypothetical protein IIU78_04205 [Alistipes sp.]|nr:hypothetical protein [Alistipes sp.]
MKKLIFSLMLLALPLIATSCEECDEPFCTRKSHNHTKSLIEMYITSESLGLDNAHIYSPYLRTRHQLLYDYLLPSGEFGIHYNLDRQIGVTVFGLYREELKYVVTKDEVYEAQIGMELLLPSGIPFELNKKYYFGNVEGVNTDDGVVVPDSQYQHYSNGIHLSFMGHNFEATHGWMMFTRLDEVSRDEDWTRNILDMRFGFVANSDEHTIIVEDGRIEDNPGGIRNHIAKPSWVNGGIGARYQDIIYCNCNVRDADEIAYMAMPSSEYDYYNQTTAEEVFERGTIVDLAPYKEGKGDNPYPIELYYYIDGLTPDTEYMVFSAALNKTTGLYSMSYSQIKTQAADGEEYKAFLWEPHAEAIAEDSATLSMLLKYADTLSYHICEGDSCDCSAEDIAGTMIPVEFDNIRSFIDILYPTIELKGLKPNTTYTVTIEAKNPISTTVSTTSFTTTDESNE